MYRRLITNFYLFEKNENELKDLWERWNELVNMTVSELSKFLDSDEGKEAGLSKEKASELKISRGRDSARALIRMIPKGKTFKDAMEKWNDNDWEWCGKQVSFISRMRKNKGSLIDDKGNKTRKYLSLLIWGHDPKK